MAKPNAKGKTKTKANATTKTTVRPKYSCPERKAAAPLSENDKSAHVEVFPIEIWRIIAEYFYEEEWVVEISAISEKRGGGIEVTHEDPNSVNLLLACKAIYQVAKKARDSTSFTVELRDMNLLKEPARFAWPRQRVRRIIIHERSFMSEPSPVGFHMTDFPLLREIEVQLDTALYGVHKRDGDYSYHFDTGEDDDELAEEGEKWIRQALPGLQPEVDDESLEGLAMPPKFRIILKAGFVPMYEEHFTACAYLNIVYTCSDGKTLDSNIVGRAAFDGKEFYAYENEKIYPVRRGGGTFLPARPLRNLGRLPRQLRWAFEYSKEWIIDWRENGDHD